MNNDSNFFFVDIAIGRNVQAATKAGDWAKFCSVLGHSSIGSESAPIYHRAFAGAVENTEARSALTEAHVTRALVELLRQADEDEHVRRLLAALDSIMAVEQLKEGSIWEEVRDLKICLCPFAHQASDDVLLRSKLSAST